tara:strand:- start:338 stop:613 length:276 start_codon:yes stop_codon:yes gene_type:complete
MVRVFQIAVFSEIVFMVQIAARWSRFIHREFETCPDHLFQGFLKIGAQIDNSALAFFRFFYLNERLNMITSLFEGALTTEWTQWKEVIVGC